MRPETDVLPVDASALGETTNLLISKYGLPVPRTSRRAGRSRPPADTDTTGDALLRPGASGSPAPSTPPDP